MTVKTTNRPCPNCDGKGYFTDRSAFGVWRKFTCLLCDGTGVMERVQSKTAISLGLHRLNNQCVSRSG